VEINCEGVINVNLKDTKIYIEEIPKKWTNRLRSGHTNIWNKGSTNADIPEVRLAPPVKGLYAEKFDDGWYWVCGCHDCLENGKPYSYIVCEEHDVCIDCGTHRKDLSDIPWGKPEGFQCKPCGEKEKQAKKREALQLAKLNNHDKWDCFNQDEIICPVCASVHSSDDIYENTELTCYICDTDFNVELDYDVKYTTNLD